MAHECQFLCENTEGVKTRNILHCHLESVLLIQFSPARLFTQFSFLCKKEQQNNVIEFI